MAGIAQKNGLLEPYECISCLFTSRRELEEKELLDVAKKSRGRTELFVNSFRKLIEKGVEIKQQKIELNRKFMTTVTTSIFGDDITDNLVTLARANKLDYRMKWKITGYNTTKTKMESHVRKEDKKKIELLFSGAEKISIFLDNSGEAVYDVAFAVHIASNMNKKVYIITRKTPYEIDVTTEETREILYLLAEKTNLGKEVLEKIEILSTGTEYPAPKKKYLNNETRKKIELSDLIISKGIANLEALMEECWPEPKRTIVLLTAKCPPISKVFQTDLGTPIIKLGYPCKR